MNATGNIYKVYQCESSQFCICVCDFYSNLLLSVSVFNCYLTTYMNHGSEIIWYNNMCCIPVCKYLWPSNTGSVQVLRHTNGANIHLNVSPCLNITITTFPIEELLILLVIFCTRQYFEHAPHGQMISITVPWTTPCAATYGIYISSLSKCLLI